MGGTEVHVMEAVMPFLQYRGSWAGLFCDLSKGEFCPLRIPPFGMAAGSPIDKTRKDSALPPGTLEKASLPPFVLLNKVHKLALTLLLESKRKAGIGRRTVHGVKRGNNR
jgi:hypothetical protein